LTSPADALLFLSIGFAGGFLGSILGIGGGSLMTPLLLAAGYDITVAVPASLLAIVGTSLGGLYVYEEKGLIDYELAVTAEAVTVPGSLTGVLIASAGFKEVMKLTLAIILLIISVDMLRPEESGNSGGDRGSNTHSLAGYASMYLAGMVSALAGIGGGVLKVPVLHKLMGVDIKEAVATSKLMVGLTGAAGALGYYLGGMLNSCLALSLLAGSLAGGLAGARTGVKLSGRLIKVLFSSFLFAMSILVIVRG